MRGKAWLPCHDGVLRALAGLCTDAEIGAETGHAEITIRKRRTAMGLPAYHPANRRMRYGSWIELSPQALAGIRRAAA